MPITLAERFWQRVNRTSGPMQPHMESACWLWTGTRDSRGYGQISVQNHHLKAHRIAYELQCGPIDPARPFVCHRCDIPLCCRGSHLFLGTPQMNQRDSWEKGRRDYSGDKHPRRKVCAAEREEICRLRGRVPQKELARRYGLTTVAIRRIQTGAFGNARVSSWPRARVGRQHRHDESGNTF